VPELTKLIYSGKVLADEMKVSEANIDEKKFVVVMETKVRFSLFHFISLFHIIHIYLLTYKTTSTTFVSESRCRCHTIHDRTTSAERNIKRAKCIIATHSNSNKFVSLRSLLFKYHSFIVLYCSDTNSDTNNRRIGTRICTRFRRYGSTNYGHGFRTRHRYECTACIVLQSRSCC
jgi:hypothetical protein